MDRRADGLVVGVLEDAASEAKVIFFELQVLVSLSLTTVHQRLFLFSNVGVERLILKVPVRQIRLQNLAEFTAVIAQRHVARRLRLLRRHLVVHVALVLVQRLLYLARETLLCFASIHLT